MEQDQNSCGAYTRINKFTSFSMEMKSKFHRDRTSNFKYSKNKINFETIFLGKNSEINFRERFYSKDNYSNKKSNDKNKNNNITPCTI